MLRYIIEWLRLTLDLLQSELYFRLEEAREKKQTHQPPSKGQKCVVTIM